MLDRYFILLIIQKTEKKLNFAGFSFLNFFQNCSSFFSFFKIMQRIKDFGGGSLIKPYLTIVALSVFRAMVIMSKNIPDNWQGFSVENIPTQLWKSQE